MRQTFAINESKQINPIDVAEDILLSQDWEFERRGEEEMVAEVPGKWCNFTLFLAWSPRIASLHVSCALDLRIAKSKREKIYELLAKANEKLWIGHFSLWTEEGVPLFRHSLLMGQNEETSWDRLAEMIEIAIDECEKFYPAFQYVVWGGKSVTDAIDSSLIETVGEA